MKVTDVAQIPCCCGCSIDRRGGSELALLWLWCRLAAEAPIQPLTWESPYAPGAPLKKAKKKKKSDDRTCDSLFLKSLFYSIVLFVILMPGHHDLIYYSFTIVFKFSNIIVLF